ncbi:MAG: PDZ domain-containing protein, partial [Acidobacteria bacterium]|nr:PDZ domain-containing protein [Acidobacteriota bacterium]
IEVSTITTQLAGQLGDTRGTVVTRMYRSSPAYQAGLRPGDVVVAFNGQRVEDAGQLLRLVADAKVGGTAAVSIIRDGKRMELRIPVEQGSRRTAR